MSFSTRCGCAVRGGLVCVLLFLGPSAARATEAVASRPAAMPSPPDEVAQSAAERAVHEQYKAEYAKKASVDRLALAGTLIRSAAATDDAATKFVLLRESRDLAAAVAAHRDALEAIDHLSAAFAIDALEMRLAALTAAAKVTPPNLHAASDLVACSCLLSDDAARAENLDLSARAAALAENVATMSKLPASATRAKAQARFAKEAREAYAQASAVRDRLRNAPDDPASNAVVGRWLCGFAGQWTRGLPYVAKGNDPVLAAAAKRELAATATPADQYEVAEAWWTVPDRPTFPRLESRRHAAAGYVRTAEASDAPPALKANALKHLDELAASDPRRSVDLLGIVDVHRDVSRGSFKWAGADLQAPRIAASDDVEFPVQPPEQYDYRVEFTRTTGDDALLQSMPHGGTYFSWVLGGWHNEFAGFEQINDALANANPTTVRRKPMLANGRRYVSLVQVRSDGFRAYLDGKLVAQWKTDYHDMTPHHLPRNKTVPALTVFASDVTIVAAEIVGFDGEPRVGRNVVSPAP